ncbi:MAG: DUF3262 family protein [Pasteurella oralis]|uniref:DUF3262 family protein n=1 Tax=Pasteurella oralis TaxID=1071947 RepID=UPI0026F4DFB8|nr:DUF3262 family protein [Pasteurella oralis]
MSDKTVQAFNIGANSTAGDVNVFFAAAIFASLCAIAAYILIESFEGVKNKNITLNKYFTIVVRTFFFIIILGYFLLR